MELTIWPGWIAGIAIGTYGVLQLALTGRQLGVSTGYCNICSWAVRTEYFQKIAKSEDGWRLWFIIGLPLGGLLGFLSSTGFDIAAWQPHFEMGTYYDSLFGEGVTALKIGGLLLGGILIGLGARMAGGCTSGHSITGMALLNRPSFLASVLFFVGGIAIVNVLFRFVLGIGPIAL